jgi:ankyrin repeat protein
MSSAVPLTQAVTSGDAKAVSAALATGADVDERNNGGQTALILAVIFGHVELVRLLVKAGANPRLRDNLGLDAVEWAQRRGFTEALELFNSSNAAPAEKTRVIEEPPLPPEPQIDTDEKSRKWLAGVKQRIQEQSAQKPPPRVIQTEPKPAPEPELKSKPAPEPEPAVAAPTPLPTRKRCPKCNAIYNSELVAYCAHHFVRLVDVDAPVFEPPQSVTSTITNTPLLWMLVLATVAIAAFTAYMISSQLSTIVIPDNHVAAPRQPQTFLKGTPVAAGELAGRALTLADAECPISEGDSRTRADTAAQTVNVHVKLDKSGKVYWARAEGGDQALRNAATEAATQSTFSPDKLRGRESEGTIIYTFTQ